MPQRKKFIFFTKNIIQLSQQALDFLNLKIGMMLLSIRSSNIAFTMGATGPLLERAENYEGEVQIYQIIIYRFYRKFLETFHIESYCNN